jgi:hypothetical protein
MAQRTLGALGWTLLTLRFVVELVLFVSPIVIGVRALGSPVGLLVGVAAAAVVVVVWGWLLSPRRRVDPPLGVRVVLELVLVVAAAVGLAATGLAAFALAFVVAEVVVLGWLWALGLPPGTDVGAQRSDAAG